MTSRQPHIRDLTISWLDKKKVKYDRLIFTGQGKKLQSARGVQVSVEDNLEEACALAGSGVMSLLLDHPWNQASILPEGCTRVPDWKAVRCALPSYQENY